MSPLPREARKLSEDRTMEDRRCTFTPFVTSVMDFFIGKLSTSLRDWLHVLQANGKSLMHKRVATSEQGFRLPSSEQPAYA